MSEQAKADYRLVQRLLKYADHLRDPEHIARSIGIEIVNEFDLANLKGMYSSGEKHRTIYLNSRLKAYLKKFVMAHEIGHDQKHRAKARIQPFKEIEFFVGKKRDEEMEANIIAAHILIDEEQLLECIREEYPVSAIAAKMSVPEDLMLIKIQEMREMGYFEFHLNEAPRRARGNYLLDYDDGGYDLFCE